MIALPHVIWWGSPNARCSLNYEHMIIQFGIYSIHLVRLSALGQFKFLHVQHDMYHMTCTWPLIHSLCVKGLAYQTTMHQNLINSWLLVCDLLYLHHASQVFTLFWNYSNIRWNQLAGLGRREPASTNWAPSWRLCKKYGHDCYIISPTNDIEHCAVVVRIETTQYHEYYANTSKNCPYHVAKHISYLSGNILILERKLLTVYNADIINCACRSF